MNMSVRKALVHNRYIWKLLLRYVNCKLFYWVRMDCAITSSQCVLFTQYCWREEKGDLARAMWIQCITQTGEGKRVQNFNLKR